MIWLRARQPSQRPHGTPNVNRSALLAHKVRGSFPPPTLDARILAQPRLTNVDRLLRQAIAKATGSPEYWSFAAARNGFSHCYFRYPAMMIAEMQRHLMRLILELQPNIRTLADPFAGSGTTVLEAMFRGLEVYASDVNPLSVLLCKSKLVLCEP